MTVYIDIDDVEKFKEYSGNVILNKAIDCLISDNAINPGVNKLETAEEAIAQLKEKLYESAQFLRV